MTFNSIQYAVFLPVVLAIYWRLRHRGQNLLLLGASYVFYGAFDWRFLSLMLFTTVVDFSVGRAMGRSLDDGRRRRLLAVSLVANLGVLATFKYLGFFTASGARLLAALGFHVAPPILKVVLPVGISFYTFHGISYTVDTYRRVVKPTNSLITFAVFVAYFPQLVAGPIGRATIQLPQFERDRGRITSEEAVSGLFLILLGLFKKVAIGDALAPAVERVFSRPGAFGWPSLVIGAWAFAFEIYADFSGYSDIARGSSRLFGIELIRNFEQPYLSNNITEFWRTWHISLSSWLRDYLYVPLGGNRRGRERTYVNLMLTMLLGGLWHGAAWTFVVWGGLHGIFLAIHRAATGRVVGTAPVSRRPWHHSVVRAVFTFQLVSLAWVFFRARTLHSAVTYVAGIVRLQPGLFDVAALALVIFAASSIVLLDVAQRRSGRHDAILEWPAVPRGATIGAFVATLMIFSGATPVPFIYFRF